MRHDDRYSMVNKRSAHVMAQHGIKKILKRMRGRGKYRSWESI